MGAEGVQSVQGERAFGIDELFFSTTDPKGRIITGNPVFVRVSGYPLDELRGRAHNVVRHPDMPRVVFRLLWRYLHDGRAVAAFVKNRAKDGRHYWVVATVVPMQGGYLSVRFKPSGELFPVAQAVYGELLEAERRVEESGGSRGAAMDAAQELLGERLGGLGLDGYDAFMHRLVADEIASRQALLADSREWRAMWEPVPADGGDPGRDALVATLGGFRAVHARMDELYADTRAYGHLNDTLEGRSRDVAAEMRLQSLNMLVATARLGEAGASIGVVARLMGDEAESARTLNAALNGHGDHLDLMLRDLAFRTAIGRLQAEQAVFFVREMLDGAHCDEEHCRELIQSITLLAGCLSDSLHRIGRASSELEGALRAMESDVGALARLLGILDALQVNGAIEAARLDGAGTVLQLLSQLQQRVRETRDQIGELVGAVADARARAGAGDDDALGGELERICEAAALLAAGADAAREPAPLAEA